MGVLRQRRALLFSIAVLSVAMYGGAFAQQKFPAKPMRIVVAGTPASTPDILARLIGGKMSENWGHAVVIENR